MAKPRLKSPEDKARVVVSILGGEMTIAEAARREGVSQTSIAKWRDRFREGGQVTLVAGARRLVRRSSRPRSKNSPRLWVRRIWSCGCGAKRGSLPGFTELEAARVEAGMTATGFCSRLGIPRATWYR